MSKQYSRESSALKMKGAGDGIKTSSTRSVERIPVPSSRKFTATRIRDESVQLKLKKALEDIEAKQGTLKKARSVAEITPTKSKRKKLVARNSTVALHATPRPAPVDAEETPSRRYHEERRLERLVYGRMLLFVWRRSKTRLAMLSESLRRRQDQINKLQNQVDCLKDLTQSECGKRHESNVELQKMENIVKSVKTENENLQAEKLALQKELEQLRVAMQDLSVELENVKNDVISKNMYLKSLENEVQNERVNNQQLREENLVVYNEMKSRETELKANLAANEKLTEALKNLQEQMRDKEEEIEMQISDLQQTAEKCDAEKKKNESLISELISQRSINEEIKKKLIGLERELASINECYVLMINENTRLKMELADKCWWKNAKNFISISWIVLQNAAYIMLPAM